jgi:hypothetical protein
MFEGGWVVVARLVGGHHLVATSNQRWRASRASGSSLVRAADQVELLLQRTGQFSHRETKTPGSDPPLPLPGICAAALKLPPADSARPTA